MGLNSQRKRWQNPLWKYISSLGDAVAAASFRASKRLQGDPEFWRNVDNKTNLGLVKGFVADILNYEEPVPSFTYFVKMIS